jgi:hypothetical protein
LKEVIWERLEAERAGQEIQLKEHEALIASQMEEITRKRDETRAKLMKIQPDSA